MPVAGAADGHLRHRAADSAAITYQSVRSGRVALRAATSDHPALPATRCSRVDEATPDSVRWRLRLLIPTGGGPGLPARGAALRGAALAATVLLAGCGSAPHGDDAVRAPANLADLAHVAEADRTTFDDLPGIEGLDALAPPQRAWVVARANDVRCDCGCIGHSINACLHQREDCSIAARMASMLVDDARTLEAAMLARQLPLDQPAEASAPEGEGVPASASAPAGAPAEGGAPADASAADGGAAPAASAPSGASAAAPSGTSAVVGSSVVVGMPATSPTASVPALVVPAPLPGSVAATVGPAPAASAPSIGLPPPGPAAASAGTVRPAPTAPPATRPDAASSPAAASAPSATPASPTAPVPSRTP